MDDSSVVSSELIKALLAEDDLGCVIRAHLYIEKQLTNYIQISVYDPSQLPKLKLNYADKVALACCLGFDHRFDSPLRQIGKLRNSFAHNLDATLSVSLVSNFFNTLPEFGKQSVHLGVAELKKLCQTPLPPNYGQFHPKLQFALIALCLERLCFEACEMAIKSQSTKQRKNKEAS